MTQLTTFSLEGRLLVLGFLIKTQVNDSHSQFKLTGIFIDLDFDELWQITDAGNFSLFYLT